MRSDRLTGQFTTQVVRTYNIRACQWSIADLRYATASGGFAFLAFNMCV